MSIPWGANLGAGVTSAIIDNFEQLAGKHVGIVGLGTWWWTGGTYPTGSYAPFPTSKANLIHDRGAVMLWDWAPGLSDGNTPSFRNRSIYQDHTHDGYIDSVADAIKALPYEVWVRVFHEMNGSWYPTWWEGSPYNLGLGSGEHRAVFRYVVNRMRARGANNIKWIWCPNVQGTSSRSSTSQSFTQLYPGDDVVDYKALDGYNFGNGGWELMQQVFEGGGSTGLQNSLRNIRAVGNPNIPIIIAETGCNEIDENKRLNAAKKADWFLDALLNYLPNQPLISGLVYSQYNDDVSFWRIDYPLPGNVTAPAFARGIALDYYGGTSIPGAGTAGGVFAGDVAWSDGADFSQTITTNPGTIEIELITIPPNKSSGEGLLGYNVCFTAQPGTVQNPFGNPKQLLIQVRDSLGNAAGTKAIILGQGQRGLFDAAGADPFEARDAQLSNIDGAAVSGVFTGTSMVSGGSIWLLGTSLDDVEQIDGTIIAWLVNESFYHPIDPSFQTAESESGSAGDYFPFPFQPIPQPTGALVTTNGLQVDDCWTTASLRFDGPPTFGAIIITAPAPVPITHTPFDFQPSGWNNVIHREYGPHIGQLGRVTDLMTATPQVLQIVRPGGFPAGAFAVHVNYSIQVTGIGNPPDKIGGVAYFTNASGDELAPIGSFESNGVIANAANSWSVLDDWNTLIPDGAFGISMRVDWSNPPAGPRGLLTISFGVPFQYQIICGPPKLSYMVAAAQYKGTDDPIPYTIGFPDDPVNGQHGQWEITAFGSVPVPPESDLHEPIVVLPVVSRSFVQMIGD